MANSDLCFYTVKQIEIEKPILWATQKPPVYHQKIIIKSENNDYQIIDLFSDSEEKLLKPNK